MLANHKTAGTMPAMQLSLSPEQFDHLLKLAYLGEILLNDWTPQEELTEEHKSSTDLLYDLCQRAEGTPSERYITFDPQAGEWVPSQLLKDEMDRHIGDYDNDVFWDELAARLARRDLGSEYGEEALREMPESYRKEAEKPLLDYYWREVRENGLDRMMIKEDLEPRSTRRRTGRDRMPKREKQAGDEAAE